jgi:rod shape-determining protein MreC
LTRSQLILFSVLVILSATPLFFNTQTNLILCERLSSVLLFPVKTIVQFLEFLTVSSDRIEELEVALNKLRLENTDLKRKLLLEDTGYVERKFKIVKAQIIGRDPSNINGYLYIDKGRKHDLYVNQPVICVNGVIGKVKFVGPDNSIVETLENRGFTISALDVKTGIYGIIKQKGSLMFDYVKVTDEINIGDSIFTSGMSSIYPKGILIGTVSKIHQTDDLFFRKVFVTSSVQTNRLTSVYIIFGEQISDLEKSQSFKP